MVVTTESAIELAVKKVAAKEVEVVIKAAEEEVLVAEIEVVEVVEVLAEEIVVVEVEVEVFVEEVVEVEKVERVDCQAVQSVQRVGTYPGLSFPCHLITVGLLSHVGTVLKAEPLLRLPRRRITI